MAPLDWRTAPIGVVLGLAIPWVLRGGTWCRLVAWYRGRVQPLDGGGARAPVRRMIGRMHARPPPFRAAGACSLRAPGCKETRVSRNGGSFFIFGRSAEEAVFLLRCCLSASFFGDDEQWLMSTHAAARAISLNPTPGAEFPLFTHGTGCLGFEFENPCRILMSKLEFFL